MFYKERSLQKKCQETFSFSKQDACCTCVGSTINFSYASWRKKKIYYHAKLRTNQEAPDQHAENWEPNILWHFVGRYSACPTFAWSMVEHQNFYLPPIGRVGLLQLHKSCFFFYASNCGAEDGCQPGSLFCPRVLPGGIFGLQMHIF